MIAAVVIVASTAHVFAATGVISSSLYSSQLLDNQSGLWDPQQINTDKIFWNTPAPYNVKVSDTELTGYVWGPGVGWISLNCSNTNTCGQSNFKVTNDGTGKLYGYAFGENTGWISFSCHNLESQNCADNNEATVTINNRGEFAGYAWSENFGWIHFDCSDTDTCVTTTWKPARQQQNTGLGGFAIVGGNDLCDNIAGQQLVVPNGLIRADGICLTPLGESPETIAPEITDEVKNFIEDNSYTLPDGWKIAPGEITCPYFPENIQSGEQGDMVKKLQVFLNVNLDSGLTVDGEYGQETREAVKEYQREYRSTLGSKLGLNIPTGNWGAFTRESANDRIGCDPDSWWWQIYSSVFPGDIS